MRSLGLVQFVEDQIAKTRHLGLFIKGSAPSLLLLHGLLLGQAGAAVMVEQGTIELITRAVGTSATAGPAQAAPTK